MNENVVEYCIPECTEIVFSVSSQERYLCFKLIEGSAKLHLGDTSVNLPLKQEYSLSLWPCITPRLVSETSCDFKVQGNHYVLSALMKAGETLRNLFGVSQQEYGFVFVLEKGTQLQTFVNESASELCVSLESISGRAEIFGYLLDPKRTYNLPPCSNLTVNSRDNKSYTVSILGDKRRIKISLIDEKAWKCMRFVQSRIQDLRLQAIENHYVGPTILVIGPSNVGKTSFCHFLANKAVENRMNPGYIDLNITQNCSTLPGAISLNEVESKHPTEISFINSKHVVLQFGSMNFNSNNIHLYHVLIRKMNELLRINQMENNTQYSGAIIDTCGSLAKDVSTIDCILQSFIIDLVVVMGDRQYYENLKKSVLKTTETEFIPKLQNIEQRDENRETRLRENMLRKYFYRSLRRNFCQNVFEAKFSDFKIYRVVSTAACDVSDEYLKIDFKMEAVACSRAIEYYILGVSKSSDVNEQLPLSEIDYFVCFMEVHTEKQTVIVLSPVIENFLGKFLILGDIKMVKN